MISKDEVMHIAKLSRLAITEEETERYQKQLSAILDYVGQLSAVNIEGIPPVSQITGREHVVRLDEVHASDGETRDALLHAMPRRSGDYLETLGVFDTENK